MFIRRLLSGLLVLAWTTQLFAQHESDNWYFGDHAGLNFSTGLPVPLHDGQTTALNADEGVASISDQNGRLLFYTNGTTVWNRNHQVMMNGEGLNGHPSSTQSAIIIPLPGNKSVYYIFTVDAEGGQKGLCFSGVDISHNNGLGEVIQKNVQLLYPVCEKITAVKHCNNKDVWVVTRMFNSSKYSAYLITPTGLSLVPVNSDSGNFLGGDIFSTQGYLKATHRGRKLAAATVSADYIEFSDFDRKTGVVSNTQILHARPSTVTGINAGVYAVEFSPNDKLMYVTWLEDRWITPANLLWVTYLYQFDISSGNAAIIQSSQYLVDSSSVRVYGGMQLASDNKIYVTHYYDSMMSRINNPNGVGATCNFQANVVNLSPGSGRFGLPTFLQSYFYNPVIQTGNCISQAISFYIDNSDEYDSVHWDFDDPASGLSNFSSSFTPAHMFSSPGSYLVTSILFNLSSCGIADTITRRLYAGPLTFSLGNDTVICDRDTLALHAYIPGALNYWSDGSTDTSFQVTLPGKYWVNMALGGCEAIDSVDVTFHPLPEFTLGEDTFICQHSGMVLTPSPASFNTYQWSTGDFTPGININRAGSYTLKVMDRYSCSMRDTINVTDRFKPVFQLPKGLSYCTGDKLELSPAFADARYQWQDGSEYASYRVTQPGLYYVTAINSCGSFSDSVNIKEGNCHIIVPNAFTPNKDGLNDIFRVLGTSLITAFEMKIYNRWGQLVFQTTEKTKGWDGSKGGQKQSTGAYVYQIGYKEQNSAGKKLIKGTVLLIR